MKDLLSLLGGRVELAGLPTTMIYRDRDRASIGDAVRELKGTVPASAPAPTAAADAEPSEADSLTRFRQVVTSLKLVFTPQDRAALEANPAERAALLKTHDEAEARATKDDLAAAKAEVADRRRRTETAVLRAVEARKARG